MEKIKYEKGKLNEQNYKERIKNYMDFAERRFEEYCQNGGYKYKKLCLNPDDDPFKNPIPHWSKLNIMVAQPDYFCIGNNRQFYAEVKASNKIKISDLKKYSAWEAMMCDPKYTLYYICFCFNDKMVIKTVSQVMELLPKSELRAYHEGNKYYVLPI